MPKISIIIVNYNGKGFMRGCLEALQGQTFKDFEVIIVDNGSLDDSLYEKKISKREFYRLFCKIGPP